ncbi:MAG: NAD(P)-dependent oxidoreductase [Zavarzinella sp.]
MPRKIFVTGGTGYLGSHVVQHLVETGHDVTVMTRSHLPTKPVWWLGVKSIQVPDIREVTTDQWQQFLPHHDLVVHLAWDVEPGKYLHSKTNQEYADATLKMALVVQELAIPRFVGVGTCLEYRPKNAPLEVDDPVDPSSLYAECKLNTCNKLRQLFTASGTQFAWARVFFLYGGDEKPQRLGGYLHQQLRQALPVKLTSGIQIRDYLPVDVAGTNIAKLALSNYCGVANICSGNATTVRELAESIADLYGRRDFLQFGALPDNPNEIPMIVGRKTEFS